MRLLLPSLVALGACLASCSSTSSTDSSTPVSLTFGLSAATPCLVSGASAGGASRVVGLETRGEKLLALSISTSLSLRPAGACGSLSPCGHVLVTVDGSNLGISQAAALTLELPLDKLGQPYGTHTVKAEIRADDDTPLLDDSGRPLAVTLLVDVFAPDDPACSPPKAP
jgi:hypothetical protein